MTMGSGADIASLDGGRRTTALRRGAYRYATWPARTTKPSLLPPCRRACASCSSIITTTGRCRLVSAQLSEWYTQLLQAGSLPARLQRLQLGESYNHPLLPGIIPASVAASEFMRTREPSITTSIN